MSGNLSLNESASHLLRQAIESGEWRAVRDVHGRECFFNDRTKETTRDLRALLLLRCDAATLQPAALAAARPASETGSDASPLQRELEIAKATIAAYEREITELRLAVFGSPRRTATPSSTTSAAAAAPVVTSETEVLGVQLSASREIAAMLLQRLNQNREQEGLCRRCLSDSAIPATAVDSVGILSSHVMQFPSSLDVSRRTAEVSGGRAEAATTRASSYAYRLSVAQQQPDARALPPSLGYLPNSLLPVPQKQYALRPNEPAYVTTHAPLMYGGSHGGLMPPQPVTLVASEPGNGSVMLLRTNGRYPSEAAVTSSASSQQTPARVTGSVSDWRRQYTDGSAVVPRRGEPSHHDDGSANNLTRGVMPKGLYDGLYRR